jgi:Threonine dehydrogenase and related Zn-dependent dehydrogenases
MIKVRTIAVTAPLRSQVMHLSTSELAGREVLVKVHAVALCTLEQRIFNGEIKMPLPCTGGHEVSGHIEALGPDVNRKVWKEGDRVAVRLLYSCGECEQCRKGRTNLCERSQRKPVRDGLLPGPGGLCDYIIVDSSSLFPISDVLSYSEAALTEPLACVVHSVSRADIHFGDEVVVIGGGIMGQLHAKLSALRGARVILSEIDADRRKMALLGGASVVVDPSEGDVVAQVRELTAGKGADVVFNTIPAASVVPQALEMVAKGGKMVQYSSVHPDVPVLFSPQAVHNNEITILGSISPKVEDFYTANKLLNSRIVDVSPYIESAFPFERGQEAFEAAVRPGAFRIIITD